MNFLYILGIFLPTFLSLKESFGKFTCKCAFIFVSLHAI